MRQLALTNEPSRPRAQSILWFYDLRFVKADAQNYIVGDGAIQLGLRTLYTATVRATCAHRWANIPSQARR